jgi:hypothetical protein
MSRDYYIHKRQNGIYYVEFIDKVSGKKLSARSTGKSEPLKAQVKAELWLVNGIPTGRMKKPRPIEETAGIESILRAIGRGLPPLRGGETQRGVFQGENSPFSYEK